MMSRLDELIQELCPDGVEYKSIKQIADVTIGEFVHKSKQNDNAKYPVFNGGITNTGFYDEYNRTANKIIISARGANAGFVNRVFTNFWSGNSCYTISVEDNSVDWNYLYYWLKSKEKTLLNEQQKAGIPAVSKKQVEEFLSPIPPLNVQIKIVEFMDKMTKHALNINSMCLSEINIRKKQFDYYSHKLFEVNNLHDVQWYNLQDIADISTGKSNTNEELQEGEYPFFVRSQEVRRKNTYEFDETAIITSGDGVGVGKIFHYIEGKYALHQRAYRIHIIDERVCPKYFFYYMKSSFLQYIQKTAFNSSVTSIRRPMLNNFPVPIPTIEEQNRIVSILDRMEVIYNDLAIGLQAEIEARQKQYEYYRDKLLTFKELKK